MNPTHFCPECGKPLLPDSQHQLCPACLMAQALASQTQDERKAAAFPPPAPEEIAGKFPQFEILECLGRGGMGVVYKARQKSLNRLVAIKILAPERERDAQFAERFAREAELLAKLSHPHIVTIHDFGVTGGLYFLVMEFVDGVNLRDLLRDGKLEPKQALAIVPELCEALQYAHDRGVIHRDIKPENILLDRQGRVKIADFGLAKLAAHGAGVSSTVAGVGDPRSGKAPGPGLTEAGKVMGTPSYMAPEQTSHPEDVDHRADIYALGVVFYQMLTGELPAEKISPPSRKVVIDVRLDEVVLRALEKEPSRRYQQASEVKTRLETIATSSAIPSGGVNDDEVAGKPAPAKADVQDPFPPDRRFDWRVSGPFQSPELKEILARMTVNERSNLTWRFIPLILLVVPASLLLVPMGIDLGNPGLLALELFWVWFFPNWIVSELMRRFYCTTGWARQQGYTPDKLRLFGFGTGTEGARSPSTLPRHQGGLLWAVALLIGCLVAADFYPFLTADRFSPTREVFLPEPAPGVPSLLNLRDGRLILPTDEMAKKVSAGHSTDLGVPDREWLRAAGADAVVAPGGSDALRLLDGFALENGDAGLTVDTITPKQVVASLTRVWYGRAPYVNESLTRLWSGQASPIRQPAMSYQTPLKIPGALVFMTRDGAAGVMQLTEDHPSAGPGLTIRYKLLLAGFIPSNNWVDSGTGLPRRFAPNGESAGPQWLPVFSALALALFLGPILLFRAVKSRAGQSSTLNSIDQPAARPEPPRFSRMAIVGACWAPLCLISVLFGLLFHTAVPFSEYRGPAWWQQVLALILLPLGLAAPFGTTILGWVAVGRIRRSAGKLYGLGLAVFDGLLFPLLALDGLILLLSYRLGVDLNGWDLSDGWKDAIWFSTFAGSVVADYFIVRRVWRAVNPGAGGGASAPAQPKPRIRWRWAAALVVVAVVVAALFYPVLTADRFGSTHEVVLPKPAPGMASVLNVAENQLLTPPDGLAQKLATGVSDLGIDGRQWLRQAGADAVAETNRPGNLRLFEGFGYNIGNGQYTLDNITPALVEASMTRLWAGRTVRLTEPEIFDQTQADVPGVFAFVTREGAIGVLEFVHPADHPESPNNVTVRYKLLRPGLIPSANWVNPGTGLPRRFEPNGAGGAPQWSSWFSALALGLLIGSVFLIRAVKADAGESSPAPALSTAKAYPGRGWRRFGITVLTLGGMLAAYVVLGLIIPNWIRERKALLVQQQQEEAAKAYGPVVPFVSPPNAEFGPVVELTLPLHGPGYSDTLDPDSGKILPTPEMATPWEWSTTFLPKGLMVISQNKGDLAILAGTGTTVWPLPGGSDYWDGRMGLSDATAGASTEVRLGESVLAASSGPSQLFCFQTASGKRGLLQVTGVNDNPRAVRLRYKLVQKGTTTSSEPPPAAPAITFGPVIERTVEEGIGFDTGKTATIPDAINRLSGDSQNEALLTWMEREGLDALWDENELGFQGVDLKTRVLDRAAWDNLTPAQLQPLLADTPGTPDQKLINGRIVQVLSHGTETPTVAFRTRTGRFGILQVSGFAASPSGVKIRYKVVQQLAAKPPEPSPAAPPSPPLATTFGPPTELSLPVDKDGLTPLLDLDHAEVIPDPNPPSLAAGMAMLAKPGVVFQHDTQSHRFTLLGQNGTVLAPARTDAGDQWETFTDSEGLSRLGRNGAPAGAMLGTSSPDVMPETFIFKTAAGATGLLQITGFTSDNPPRMKIRIKRLQAMPESSASDPTTPPPATFGPVMKRLLADTECVAFDSGMIANVPDSAQGDEAKVVAWLEAQAMDAVWVADEGDDDTGFWGIDLKAVKLDSAAWDNVTPEQLSQALAVATKRSFQQLSHEKETPAWAFQTRTGRLGILQVTGFADQPAAVEIRYRLVQVALPQSSESATPPAMPLNSQRVGDLLLTVESVKYTAEASIGTVDVTLVFANLNPAQTLTFALNGSDWPTQLTNARGDIFKTNFYSGDATGLTGAKFENGHQIDGTAMILLPGHTTRLVVKYRTKWSNGGGDFPPYRLTASMVMAHPVNAMYPDASVGNFVIEVKSDQ